MENKFLSLKPDLPRSNVEAWEQWYSIDNPSKYVGRYNDKIRNQILINLVRWSKRERGLDMACGEGSLTHALAPHVKSMKAFDISANAIQSARRKYPAANVDYFQMDMKDFSSEVGSFDFIMCAEVIYHLQPHEIDKVLAEVKKSLESGGYFILTTRTDRWFGFNDFMNMLEKHFTIITIVPVWRPDKIYYKAIKRLFSIFSPFFDRVYRSWILGISPNAAGDVCLCVYQ